MTSPRPWIAWAISGSRREGVVELTAAVVRHDDACRSRIEASDRIIGTSDALGQHGESGEIGEPGHVVIGDRRIELPGDDGHEPLALGMGGARIGEVGQGEIVGEVDATAQLG